MPNKNTPCSPLPKLAPHSLSPNLAVHSTPPAPHHCKSQRETTLTQHPSLQPRTKRSLDSTSAAATRGKLKLPLLRLEGLRQGSQRCSTNKEGSFNEFRQRRSSKMSRSIVGSVEGKSEELLFLKTAQQNQSEFMEACANKDYSKAQAVLCKLLNYAIDLDLIKYLCLSLKLLAEFNFHINHINKAFFYFNQGRKAGLYTGNHELLVQCLMKMSACVAKQHLYNESLIFLKKALQHVWYYEIAACYQLRIYDEMGKIYYLMGNTHKAKIYHQRFFTGELESKDSYMRTLSKQSLNLVGLDCIKKETTINNVFLYMLQVPLKNTQLLSQLQQSENKGNVSPRKTSNKDMRFFQEFKTVKQLLRKILQENVFHYQIGQPFNSEEDWTTPDRSRRFISLQIQRNNHLQSLGISYKKYFNAKKMTRVLPINLSHKMKTQGNQSMGQQNASANFDEWYKAISSDAITKHKSSYQGILNRVQIRGLDKPAEVKLGHFRGIYGCYYATVLGSK